ncbi:hypothetical protein BD413DRAFT_609040 [Trametes elegans]|nr:hypothetical protein BD413DRAFT_609040 [Trametes elegans]
MPSSTAPARTKQRSKSFLGRRSTKKHDQPPAPKQRAATDHGPHDARPVSMDMHEKAQENARPMFNPFAYSLVPDPLNELPPWYHREVEVATASAAQFRAQYPLHNPVGPRWYRNHHLLPPMKERRPSSVFSPSFPPMSPASERTQDPARMAGPSRTPSGSPLPTPSSSQIRIQEPPKPRSRKVSLTAHDNVDMMDGTDPWDPQSPISPRSRRQSMTNGIRHKTVTPSPLSQSTSAVHLHEIDREQIQLPRKLSKRRKPFNGLFASGDEHDEGVHEKILRRQSAMAPSMTSLPSLQPPSQKMKRGSVLGRLVKRFSVMRKPLAAQNGPGGEFTHFASADNSRMTTPVSPNPPDTDRRTSSRFSRSPDPGRRIPPPSIEVVQDGSMHAESRRSSDSVSVHEIMTSGRLTVANPDEPVSSGHNTPVQDEAHPLPASIPEETTPRPMSRDDLPLPDVPRTESPAPVEVVGRSSRSQPVRVPESEPIRDVPPPPSSPPLPALPPPTPATVLQSLPHPGTTPSDSSSSPSTAGPSSSVPAQQQEHVPQEAVPPPATDDPLARASLFVNPPTPYTAPLLIPAKVSEVPEPASSQPVERSSTKAKADRSRSKSSIGSQSRQTETFKLIRSPSGTIKQVGDVITGMGEQWEVVESPVEHSNSKKAKSKDKDRERSKSDADTSVRRHESKRREQGGGAEEPDSRHRRHASTGGREKPPSVNSMRSTQTPYVPERVTSTKSSRRSSTLKKPRAEEKEGRAARATSPSSPVSPVAPQQSAHERHGSVHSTRPSSELHSAAEFASMKAKEAWEMERLWKARSMAYGPDGMPVVSTPATIGSDSRPSTFISTELQRVSSIPSVAAVADLQRAASPAANPVHGSSHTYVVVQTPYQGAQGQAASYAQFASASSAPILYPSGSPPPHPQGHPAHKRPSHSPSPPVHLRNPLVDNPLPEPPRLSTYEPAPVPPSLANAWSHSP